MVARHGAAPPADARTIGSARGLGLEVGGEGRTLWFAHGGDNEGYRSQLIALGDGRGVVILTNGSSQALLREIVRAVATEYGWPVPQFLPVQRRIAAVPETVLRRYVGSYEWPEGRRPSVDAVTLENGRLMTEGQVLHPESETRFFTDAGATYTFLVDAAGLIQGFRFEVPGLTHVTRKLET
jgi:hypothetical protein